MTLDLLQISSDLWNLQTKLTDNLLQPRSYLGNSLTRILHSTAWRLFLLFSLYLIVSSFYLLYSLHTHARIHTRSQKGFANCNTNYKINTILLQELNRTLENLQETDTKRQSFGALKWVSDTDSSLTMCISFLMNRDVA